MSKADEMFKKCGFNKIDVINKLTGEVYPNCTEYVKWDGTWEEHIQFNDSTKLMTTSCELFGKATIGMIFYPELLQAINEKVGELRMDRIIESLCLKNKRKTANRYIWKTV